MDTNISYKLTYNCQINKRGKDKKSRSFLIYFLNGIEILKQKIPFEINYDNGFNHKTDIKNDYLLNGRIHQTRTKFEKTREVSFPISKNKLIQIGVPMELKINAVYKK